MFFVLKMLVKFCGLMVVAFFIFNLTYNNVPLFVHANMWVDKYRNNPEIDATIQNTIQATVATSKKTVDVGKKYFNKTADQLKSNAKQTIIQLNRKPSSHIANTYEETIEDEDEAALKEILK